MEEVENWLELKEGELVQADFYDPDLDLEMNASEEEEKAAYLRNTAHHT